MQLKNVIVIAMTSVLVISCGENSTKADSNDTLTTSDVTTVESSPVHSDVIVPEPIKTSFQSKYPAVSNEVWSRYEPIETFDWEWAGWPVLDTSDYMVRFNQDGSEYWVWYDADEWVGTISPVTDFAGLPSAVNKTIQSTFPDYTIVSVDKESDNDRTAYEVELEKGNEKVKALIGENGTVYKKKTNINGVRTKEKIDVKKEG